eukprot:357696-Chlamydomonas_euryale.AAC.2
MAVKTASRPQHRRLTAWSSRIAPSGRTRSCNVPWQVHLLAHPDTKAIPSWLACTLSQRP